MHATTGPIDTSVMPTIHTFFRREIRLAGGVVRRVADGDVRRAGVVADHLDFVARSLHEHHTGEDELLWPKLLERVPEELAPIVRLMEAQHGQVDALLSEIGDVRVRWAATAAPADRDRLADLFDQLYVHLAEHLDAEEERLLPIAARAVTQAEWAELGERGRARTRRSELSLALGMFQYEGDPAVIAQMLAEAPAPVRWIVPRLSRRAFRRRALAIHGTATP
ncbi:hemerythrin domain-containing protein [Blastococcus sp. CT_GayMR19]|uniref:hemerythrin domain-containing protein n=1 Tax=Blastococcus sp. CT_GayMR19 TaxID=2559608 RepID=UPI0010745E82|nr:hemerythrin domain-containing protein [Blastococcus sp. CT_GayMR19]TFV73870.1 hemerythrin domain-containing protein [Blastococcus sp. CT_GayMR19]